MKSPGLSTLLVVLWMVAVLSGGCTLLLAAASIDYYPEILTLALLPLSICVVAGLSIRAIYISNRKMRADQYRAGTEEAEKKRSSQ